ncbi:MAG TPA: type II toxin-antitoxin system HicB family antitoxin [Azospirillaceae bacterium]|nr:type II toxin-antitoxin system HicB family antitoxin [Azospirillaceae bacterium]
MRYPILIEPGSDTEAFGVVVPDLPGCFSAGDTLDEALDNVREAIAAWIDEALDGGEVVPPPSPLSAITGLPDYQGWIVGVVEVDDALADDTIERVNITLPRRVLGRLDALARDAGQSRGGFIADLTLKAHALRTPGRPKAKRQAS